MRAALVLLAGLCLGAPARGAPACAPLKDWEGRAVRLSKHAAERRVEREISCADLKKTLEACEPFRYRHARKLKTGCYDKKSKVFAALEEGVVITVIAEPGEAYIRRLKRTAPKK